MKGVGRPKGGPGAHEHRPRPGTVCGMRLHLPTLIGVGLFFFFTSQASITNCWGQRGLQLVNKGRKAFLPAAPVPVHPSPRCPLSRLFPLPPCLLPTSRSLAPAPSSPSPMPPVAARPLRRQL